LTLSQDGGCPAALLGRIAASGRVRRCFM